MGYSSIKPIQMVKFTQINRWIRRDQEVGKKWI
jgi:hypothetical protein